MPTVHQELSLICSRARRQQQPPPEHENSCLSDYDPCLSWTIVHTLKSLGACSLILESQRCPLNITSLALEDTEGLMRKALEPPYEEELQAAEEVSVDRPPKVDIIARSINLVAHTIRIYTY